MIMMMKRCWAPCFTINRSNSINIERASVIIAIYTAILHFFGFFYAISLFGWGQSDFIVSPYFHADRSLKTLAIWTMVYCAFYIFSSFLLILGIKKEIRFLYLFWLICTFFEIAGIVFIGGFLIYRYRFFPEAMFSLTALWTYNLFHVYLFWAVVSQYYYLKVFQEPTFILLYA
ncbi:uncharacterized protein LOC141853927 [Brevipalpus obovatus]|uniref:uncharacterized protein LOC141853927 n=1 Tax=Brevipalpus obovatus TaxID=246614 RepID=UPI003D9F6EA2